MLVQHTFPALLVVLFLRKLTFDLFFLNSQFLNLFFAHDVNLLDRLID